MKNNDFESWMAVDDKRVETRLVALVTLHVEISSGDPDSGESGNVVECETLDLSANGIQALSPVHLPEGALLPVRIQVDGQSFSLISEVKWAKQVTSDDGEQRWSTGFLIQESDESDVLLWKEAVVNWLS